MDAAVSILGEKEACSAQPLSPSSSSPLVLNDESPPGLNDESPPGLNVSLLVFHHHPIFDTTHLQPAVASIELCGFNAVQTVGGMQAKASYVGEKHGNFWNEWWEDQAAANLSHASKDYAEGWSAYSDSPQLTSSRARALFASGLSRYKAGARIYTGTVQLKPSGAGGCLSLNISLPAHEVVLLEFEVAGCV